MDTTLPETVRLSLLQLMEETLHSHQGMYTEPGTSLVETLAGIDAAVASRRHPPLPQTIAGHVGHAQYYLDHMLAFLKGAGSEEFDVPLSWKYQNVNPDEWEALKASLEATYSAVMGFIARAEDWPQDGKIASLVAGIAHSAYHLGAIRQLKDL
jgi:hypothetical protein